MDMLRNFFLHAIIRVFFLEAFDGGAPNIQRKRKARADQADA